MAKGDVTWGDNVIYADFGARGSARAGGEPAATGRRQAASKVVRPRTPVARRLYDAVADPADSGRRTRGEAYFRDGNVLGFRMVDGQIVGEVRGSQIEPFTVLIKLPYRDASDLDGIMRWLAETPGAADDLEKGVLPGRQLDRLLLSDDEAPTCRCSCPDAVLVCKHAIAVAAAAGRSLDSMPLAAMELRGLGVHEARHRLAALIADTVAKKAGRDGDGGVGAGHRAKVRRPTGPRTEDPVLELVEQDFWGVDLPIVDIPAPSPMQVLRDTDATLLHAALRSTTVLSVETLRAVADLEDCWDHLAAPPSFDDGGLDGPDRRRGVDDPSVVAASFDDEDDEDDEDEGE